jgi:hypothetical protein
VQWQNVAVKTIQKNDSCLIKLNFDALIRENTAGLKHFSQLKCCPHHGKGANRPVPSFHSEDSLGRQHVISSESQVRTANPHSILLCEPLLIDFCDDHFFDARLAWIGLETVHHHQHAQGPLDFLSCEARHAGMI